MRTRPVKAPATKHPARAPQLALLALGLGLVLGACSNPDNATLNAASTAATSVSLPRALDAMLRPNTPSTAEHFLASLPQPVTADERRVANPIDPRRSDVVRTLHFAGLDLAVYHVSATGARFPMAVTVTSAAYHSADGLHVGMRRGDVQALLGSPSARTAGTWLYRVEAPRSAPYQLTVRFDGDTVAALRWSAYLD